MEPLHVQSYLHHNVPTFFGNIGDLADCLETFSLADFNQSQVEFGYDHQAKRLDLQYMQTFECALAVTEFNTDVIQSEAKRAVKLV